MSRKQPNGSSTSVRSVRKNRSVTLGTPTLPEASTLTTSQGPEVVELPSSRSRANEFFEAPKFRIEWDNDVKHHLARNLLHLRRFRGWSQARVAREMGSSQPAIARIEAGEENITLNTLERLIAALRGRFLISLPPVEFQVNRFGAWWESGGVPVQSSTTGWATRFIAIQHTDQRDRALVGLERERGTLQSNFLMANAGT